MDPLSIAINSINYDALTFLSLIIDDSLFFAIIVVLSIVFFEKDNNKRGKLFAALFLAFLLGATIKSITEVPRPCSELTAKTECNSGYSFPSLHTLIAFTLALGFLDEKKYPGFLLFALFVAFSRIYLGVHSFTDVAASLALSPIVYGLVDIYWSKVRK